MTWERIEDWRKLKKENDPEYFRRYHQEWRAKNPVKYLLRKAANRAQQECLEFNLTEKDIVIPELCPVFKTPFTFEKGDPNNSPSIDRFDSEKGYIRDNIHVISWRANKLKNNGTLEEFRSLVRWMEEKERTEGG